MGRLINAARRNVKNLLNLRVVEIDPIFEEILLVDRTGRLNWTNFLDLADHFPANI